MQQLNSLPTETLQARVSDFSTIINSTLRQEGRHTQNTKRLAKLVKQYSKELESRNQ